MRAAAKTRFLLALIVAFLAACAERQPVRPPAPVPPAPPSRPPAKKPPPAPTVDSVVKERGPEIEPRLKTLFDRARVAYPPAAIDLLAFKQERKIELWARKDADAPPAFVRSYRILRASGKSGPKLEDGDWQVPEGEYRVVRLNPTSQYHLSLELDYPNEFDRRKASEEGRTNLGDDIYIHGSDLSSGCLAVGDAGVEELFVLAAAVGSDHVRVLIAPNDLRHKPPPHERKYSVAWLGELYSMLRAALAVYR